MSIYIFKGTATEHQ